LQSLVIVAHGLMHSLLLPTHTVIFGVRLTLMSLTVS
jgi:hypothetical protein